MKRLLLFVFINAMLLPLKSEGWGFYAHQRIDRLAVFTLPPEMIGFYKKHIVYITETAVKPDSRRTIVPGEAPKHYIDVDVYGDSAVYKLPRFWKDAVAKYGEDTLMAYGIVPWHINLMKFQLIKSLYYFKDGCRAVHALIQIQACRAANREALINEFLS